MMSVLVAFAASKTRSLMANDKTEPNNGKSEETFLDFGQASVLVLRGLIGAAGTANIKVLRADCGGMNVARVKLAVYQSGRYWVFLVRWDGVINGKGRHA